MKDNKLSLMMLIAIGIGAMIGTGIFGIPADMAGVAGPFATIIAWGITGVGILALAFVYKILAEKKENIKGGLFGFAKAGFGEYTGALISWGYYISAILANIAYYLLVAEVLDYFFPFVNSENEGISIIQVVIVSIFIWILNYVLCKGAKDTASINFVTTVCKVVPLVLFIIIVLFAFDMSNFTNDFYGLERKEEIGSVFNQIKGTMTITLWTFLGIEGIGVLSTRARKMKDVGSATMLAVIMTLSLYLLVSLGSLGIMPSSELAKLGTPSVAYVLSSIVGPWGEQLINVAILISVTGALIGWTLIAVEISYLSSKDGLMFDFSGKEKNGVPKNAVIITSVITQVLIGIAYLFPSTYQTMYLISTSAILIPYLVSALYAVKVVLYDEVYRNDKNKTRDLMISVFASIYAIWLLYAADLKLLLLVTIVYAIGVLVYIYNKKSKGEKAFTPITGAVSLAIVISSIISIILFATGSI